MQANPQILDNAQTLWFILLQV